MRDIKINNQNAVDILNEYKDQVRILKGQIVTWIAI